MQRTMLVRRVACALLGWLTPIIAHPQAAHFGQVHFPTSCAPSVQPQFDEALALLHSFEFKQAEASFAKVESRDPSCSIAAWGIALAQTQRDGANAPRKDLAAGWKQLQPWLKKKAGTPREQMYLDAVRAMYKGYDHTSGTVRWARYLARMDALRCADPHDINASLFYALGLVWTAGPGDPGLAQRRRALAILLPIFHEYPDNPGAAHYIIHAADTPQLAIIALPAARKYASIAPDSPHALHMPSHIFNRLGLWQESVASNLASAHVAAAWVKDGQGGLFDELHALNNLEYAYLQLGQDSHARAVIARIDQAASGPNGDPWAGIDARIYYDLETHDWQAALQLQPPPKSTFKENFDTYWIHAIAAARSGQPQEAATSLEDFRKSSAEWTKNHGFAGVFHLAFLQAQAWTLFSQGKHDDALTTLREAEQFEQAHPMYYADVLPRPSAQMEGDMLLQLGEPAAALRAYNAALKIAPNTWNALQGVKQSAAQTAKAAIR
jgi:tetratricopeptide (TPR) repeat protein